MDELIVLLVRWIIGLLADKPKPGMTGRATPALPPAWSGGGPATPQAPRSAAKPTVRRGPPPLRVGRGVRPVQAVQAVQSVAGQQAVTLVPTRPAAVAVTHSGITPVRSAFTTEAIRRNWVMYELLQPPVGLREPQ